MPRRGLSLTWRGAVLASAAIGLLSVVASVAAFVVVQESLRSTLQAALRADAARVAALYMAGAAGSARDQLAGPTGGVIVQLYDPLGALLVATETRYARPDAAIAPALLATARDVPRDWRGTLAGHPVQVALTPFEFGVVAVASETGYIGASLSRLGRALALTAAGLVLLSAVVGSAVAAAIVRPIRRLAH
ncbi:MAG: hypothetical protein O3A02_04095, partial [bacterium]|nr:hypothetical protein [bacterium]